ncbi:hypothetical protein EMMF5_005097 [Cystobasidiomycetes sp. EMM_F5]
MLSSVVVASAFAALTAAAPLTERWADDNLWAFNHTWPKTTIFGPFTAVQKFDPTYNWFRGCGYWNQSYEYVVSIKSNNTYSKTESCGVSLNITNPKTGKSALAMIVDECLQCSYDYLSVSPAVFDLLAPAGAANFTATYQVVDKVVPAGIKPSSWTPPPSSTWKATYTPSSTPYTAPVTKPTSSAAWTPATSSAAKPSSSSVWTPQSSSSQYVAPKSSSSSAWTPTSSKKDDYTPTTSAYTPPATTQQSSSNSGSSSGGYSYYGRATWYEQNGQPGACGNYNNDYAYIVALDSSAYSWSNCGRKVVIQNTSTGKTITATVADECPTCGGYGNLDLSIGAYSALGDLSSGVFGIAWKFA